MSHPAWDSHELRVRSDPPRRAARRLLQGWWRDRVLGEPPGRDEDGVVRNNLLDAQRVRRDPSLNFLSASISDYVQARAPEVIRLGGTLDEDRLFRNLLSSMPLCFNVFGGLRDHPEAACAALSRVTGLDIARIHELDVEWIPQGAHPLGDRTAFDAWIAYGTSQGRRGFLGVETKYTESFSRKPYDKPRYREITAEEDSGFLPGAADRLLGPATNQLWRNALLAAAVRSGGDFDEGRVWVVAPAGDPHVVAAMDGFADAHQDIHDLVISSSLEELVASMAREAPLRSLAEDLRRRYLDLSPTLGAQGG